MIRVAPHPQRIIVGAFLVLAAIVCAVAPMPVVFRSVGVVLFSYLAFGMGGMPFAYVAALLAPPIGLLSGSTDWLVMLPIVLSGNLLAMLALEYAWRYPALLLSPLLLIAPSLFVISATQSELFAVELPWAGAERTWLTLHLLVALLGILAAFVLDRRRSRRAADERPSDDGARRDVAPPRAAPPRASASEADPGRPPGRRA